MNNTKTIKLEKSKYPMFGNTIQMTIDELVEEMTPNLDHLKPSEKRGRYLRLHRAFLKLYNGLGPQAGGEAYFTASFIMCAKMAELHDELHGIKDDEGDK